MKYNLPQFLPYGGLLWLLSRNTVMYQILRSVSISGLEHDYQQNEQILQIDVQKKKADIDLVSLPFFYFGLKSLLA